MSCSIHLAIYLSIIGVLCSATSIPPIIDHAIKASIANNPHHQYTYKKYLIPSFGNIFSVKSKNGTLRLSINQQNAKLSEQLVNSFELKNEPLQRKSCRFTVSEMFSFTLTITLYKNESLCIKKVVKNNLHREWAKWRKLRIPVNEYTKSIFENSNFLLTMMRNALNLLHIRFPQEDFVAYTVEVLQYISNCVLMANGFELVDQQSLSKILSMINQAFVNEFCKFKGLMMAEERNAFFRVSQNGILLEDKKVVSSLYEHETINLVERLPLAIKADTFLTDFESVIIEKNSQVCFVNNLAYFLEPILTSMEHVSRYCNVNDQVEIKGHSLPPTLWLIQTINRIIFYNEVIRAYEAEGTTLYCLDLTLYSVFESCLQPFVDKLLRTTCLKSRMYGQFMLQYIHTIMAAEVESARIGLNAYIPTDLGLDRESIFMNLTKRIMTIKKFALRTGKSTRVHEKWMKVLCCVSRWYRIFGIHDYNKFDALLIDIIRPMTR